MLLSLTRAFGLALLLGAGAASAQPKVAAAPLTLERALELAFTHNETPDIARARLARAEAQTRESWARLLPDLTLQGTYTRRQRAVEREVGGQSTVIQSQNALGATATASMRLIDAPAVPLIMRAGRLEQAARHEAEVLVQQLAYQVANLFYAVLSAEELLAAAERRVAFSERGLQVARRRLEAGLVGKQEVTRTELSLSTARLQQTDARMEVRINRLALGELLAVPVKGQLAAPAPVEPGPAAPGAEERPDVLSLKEQIRAAELVALEPWLGLLPSLDVSGTYRLTNEPGLSGQPQSWTLSAVGSWVLYDGGLRYAQARARAAEAAELRYQLSALLRGAERERLEARVRLEASLSAVEEAGTATRIARENASEVERLFEAGLATALERDDATVSAYEAEAQLAQKTFASRMARLEERRARGLWPVSTKGPTLEAQ